MYRRVVLSYYGGRLNVSMIFMIKAGCLVVGISMTGLSTRRKVLSRLKLVLDHCRSVITKCFCNRGANKVIFPTHEYAIRNLRISLGLQRGL
jgi:hypothetical protein